MSIRLPPGSLFQDSEIQAYTEMVHSVFIVFKANKINHYLKIPWTLKLLKFTGTFSEKFIPFQNLGNFLFLVYADYCTSSLGPEACFGTSGFAALLYGYISMWFSHSNTETEKNPFTEGL